MIVATMTEAELFKEVITDVTNVLKFSDTKDQKFRRMVIKSSRFPVYAHSFYTSPRKNNWIVFFEARSKKEIGDCSRITFATYYNSPHGLHVVMVSYTDKKQHLIIYPPHFFSRFAKRCSLDLFGVDLIIRYLRLNASYVFSFNSVKSGDDRFKNEIYGSSKEGVALGIETSEGNVLFKTFITYGMTKGDQIEDFARNEEIRKEIHESL